MASDRDCSIPDPETTADLSKDMNLNDWLKFHFDEVVGTSDILKAEMVVINDNKVEKYRESLGNEHKPDTVRISKSIVTAYVDAIGKAVKNLQNLSLTMGKELRDRFNLPEDWLDNTSMCGSEIHGPTFSKNHMERVRSFINDGVRVRNDAPCEDFIQETETSTSENNQSWMDIDDQITVNTTPESSKLGENEFVRPKTPTPSDSNKNKDLNAVVAEIGLDNELNSSHSQSEVGKKKTPVKSEPVWDEGINCTGGSNLNSRNNNEAFNVGETGSSPLSGKQIAVGLEEKESTFNGINTPKKLSAIPSPTFSTPSKLPSSSTTPSKSPTFTTPSKSPTFTTPSTSPAPSKGKTPKKLANGKTKPNETTTTKVLHLNIPTAIKKEKTEKERPINIDELVGETQIQSFDAGVGEDERNDGIDRVPASDEEFENVVNIPTPAITPISKASSSRVKIKQEKGVNKSPDTSKVSLSNKSQKHSQKNLFDDHDSSTDSDGSGKTCIVPRLVKKKETPEKPVHNKIKSDNVTNSAADQGPDQLNPIKPLKLIPVAEIQEVPSKSNDLPEEVNNEQSQVSPIYEDNDDNSTVIFNETITSDQEKKAKEVTPSSFDEDEAPIPLKEFNSTDPKLKKMKSVVRVEKLAPQIEKTLNDQGYVTLKGYRNMRKLRLDDLVKANMDDFSDSDCFASDDSVEELEKALKKLSRNSIIRTKTHQRKKGADVGQKQIRSRPKVKRKAKVSSGDEAETDSSSDDSTIITRSSNQAQIKLNNAISDSGSEDLEPEDSSDEDKKKGKKVQPSRTTDRSNRKKYQIVSIDSDTDSERANRKAVLTSDSDSDSKKSKPRIHKRRLKSSGSDSEYEAPSKKGKGKKKATKESDSDVITVSSGDDSDDSHDSDFKDEVPSRFSKRARENSPDTKTKTKKKRRRIVGSSDNDSKDKDSDIEEVSQDEQEPSSSQKGRKNIRKIMSTKALAKTTREAEREEEERRKRLAEKQKQFNGIHKVTESSKVEQLVLDYDVEAKKSIVEVAPEIVHHLKPHQVDGIKFMFNACFESVQMVKEKKAPGGCILAHCMGLGKTLQSVAFVHTLLANKELEIRTALVICPLSTVNNWFNEFKNWTEDAEFKVRIHKLYDAKNTISSRIDYLRVWQKRGGVGILHYDMFRRLADPKQKAKMKESARKAIAECLLDPGPDIVICDEGHLLKNCKSLLSLAVNGIKTHRRVVLTGTPLQNNLVEYHTMMDFVKPKLLGSLQEFTNRFVNPIKNGQHADSTENDVRRMKSRAHVLHRKLEGCVQRFDYSILAPYLPPKYEYIINIKLSDKQAELYKHYLEHVVSSDLIERRKSLLKYYAELVKVWSHPIALTMAKSKDAPNSESSDSDSLKDFIDDDTSTSELESGEGSNSSKRRKLRSQPGDPENLNGLDDGNLHTKWWNAVFKNKTEMHDVDISGKLVVLQQILRTSENIGDKVLVFSQFLTSLNIIEEFLHDWDKEAAEANKDKPLTFPLVDDDSTMGRWRKNIEYFRIDGQTKVSDRHRDCERFNKKSTVATRAKLFLISTKAGGLGINLYGANRVVIFDASWNPSQDMQSIFRVYRFGQDKPCYIYRLIARGTMEEKILRRQITKLSLSSRVVDEHQIERHFKFDDVNEMYRYDEEDSSVKNTMAVPKDRLLADLLISHVDWIRSYEEFDSLLENKPDEGLSNEEKELAWEEYKNESARKLHVNNNLSNTEADTLEKVKDRLRQRHGYATEEQILDAAEKSVLVINKIRFLMLQQNRLPPQQVATLNPILDKLKGWLSVTLSPPPPGENLVPSNYNPNVPIVHPVPKEVELNYAPYRPPAPRRQYVPPPHTAASMMMQNQIRSIATNQMIRNMQPNANPYQPMRLSNPLAANGGFRPHHMNGQTRRDPLS